MKKLLKRDPESIGGFELIGRLGAGGLGVVYLAFRDGVTVALKVMREALVDEPTEQERFRREIEVLRKVNSPHVAKIIDSGIDEETAWFATEFVNGPNLKEHIDTHGPITGEDWFALARGLLGGLQDIHRVGIVHRDIKPANIILENGHPKIIDFGISQMAEATSLTITGLVAGSPAWFAPEQIDGRDITPATDLFAAGSVLTYAASSKTPWGDPDTMTPASALRIGVGDPDLGTLSSTQKTWIEPLIRSEPAERNLPQEALEPQVPRGLTKANHNLDSGPEKTTSQPAAPSQERQEPPKRRQLLFGLLGTVTGLSLVLGVLFAAGNLTSPDGNPDENVATEGVEDEPESGEIGSEPLSGTPSGVEPFSKLELDQYVSTVEEVEVQHLRFGDTLILTVVLHGGEMPDEIRRHVSVTLDDSRVTPAMNCPKTGNNTRNRYEFRAGCAPEAWGDSSGSLNIRVSGEDVTRSAEVSVARLQATPAGVSGVLEELTSKTFEQLTASDMSFTASKAGETVDYKLDIPQPFAAEIAQVKVRIRDSNNRTINFRGNETLEACGAEFELPATIVDDAKTRYQWACGGPAIDSGWAELTVTDISGNTRSFTIGFS